MFLFCDIWPIVVIKGIPFDTEDAMFNPPALPKHVQHPTIVESTPPTTPTPDTPQQRPPVSLFLVYMLCQLLTPRERTTALKA